jgi:hypothetical protein
VFMWKLRSILSNSFSTPHSLIPLNAPESQPNNEQREIVAHVDNRGSISSSSIAS